SDDLTKHVSFIEEVINKLNLGIKAHVVATQSSNFDESETHYVRLAYGKFGRKWGLIIEEFTDQQNWPDYVDFETWPFHEAPRELRIIAVDKIPDLLEALVKQSTDITSKLVKKVGFAKELAARVVPSPQGSKK